MSQNDFTIVNQTFPIFRSDLNDALQALASLSSGPSAPSTTYANMLWYDTGNNILKMRTEADDAWIDIGELDQSTNTFRVSGLTTLNEATWEAGTSTTESLVSPAKVKAAIEANASGATLLADLNPTSGTAVTASGLDLSGYQRIMVSVLDLEVNAASRVNLKINGEYIFFEYNGSTEDHFFINRGGAVFEIDLDTGQFLNRPDTNYVDKNIVTNSSTSITFALEEENNNTVNFQSGQIRVWGVL